MSSVQLWYAGCGLLRGPCGTSNLDTGEWVMWGMGHIPWMLGWIGILGVWRSGHSFGLYVMSISWHSGVSSRSEESFSSGSHWIEYWSSKEVEEVEYAQVRCIIKIFISLCVCLFNYSCLIFCWTLCFIYAVFIVVWHVQYQFIIGLGKIPTLWINSLVRWNPIREMLVTPSFPNSLFG